MLDFFVYAAVDYNLDCAAGLGDTDDCAADVGYCLEYVVYLDCAAVVGNLDYYGVVDKNPVGAVFDDNPDCVAAVVVDSLDCAAAVEKTPDYAAVVDKIPDCAAAVLDDLD